MPFCRLHEAAPSHYIKRFILLGLFSLGCGGGVGEGVGSAELFPWIITLKFLTLEKIGHMEKKKREKKVKESNKKQTKQKKKEKQGMCVQGGGRGWWEGGTGGWGGGGSPRSHFLTLNYHFHRSTSRTQRSF